MFAKVLAVAIVGLTLAGWVVGLYFVFTLMKMRWDAGLGF